MRRREGCSRESEDAAVAHLCLPRAPPISAPAPFTDAKGGNRAGKIWCVRGAGPRRPQAGVVGTLGDDSSSPGWETRVRVGGIHRCQWHGTAHREAADSPASRSHDCQPLGKILAIFGGFCAKIHSED